MHLVYNAAPDTKTYAKLSFLQCSSFYRPVLCKIENDEAGYSDLAYFTESVQHHMLNANNTQIQAYNCAK